MNLYEKLSRALETSDPSQKCRLVFQLNENWLAGKLERSDTIPIEAFDDVGRPQHPVLVDPKELEKRSMATPEGRILFLHAFAHIEFNAINIALDAVYRFRHMPEQFVTDWLQVASEEAKHFTLIETELKHRGSYYGEFSAHRGLWDMVCKTRHDVLHRMALVPRVMEARGLDVTPSMIGKFQQQNDQAAVEILEVIYRDEINHVRIGNDWYKYLCGQQSLDPANTFSGLIEQYLGDSLRGPFNRSARLQAGFSEEEMTWLETK